MPVINGFSLNGCASGQFLINNYHQALKILDTEEMLQASMNEHGISDPSVFTTWLKEEKEYLEGLLTEPPAETLEMDYYEALVKLRTCQ
jgi:hypothetical protein